MGSKEAVGDILASVARCCWVGELICVEKLSIPSWGVSMLSSTMAMSSDNGGEDIVSLCVVLYSRSSKTQIQPVISGILYLDELKYVGM